MKLLLRLAEHELRRETGLSEDEVQGLRGEKELLPGKVLGLPPEVVHLEHAPQLLEVQRDGPVLGVG